MAVTVDDHFDAAEFDELIEHHGTPAIWRKARTCPCMSKETGQPDPICPWCEKGIIWGPGEELTILAPGRNRKDDYDQIGAWMSGIITLTFPSTALPGHFDRVELTAAEMVVDNERQERGPKDRFGRTLERLRFGEPLRVEFCEAIVDGELRSYSLGTDFTVDGEGRVHWVTDHGPPINGQYTLRYVARPTYVVWSPQSRDEGGNRQPYRCAAQRLDMFSHGGVEMGG